MDIQNGVFEVIIDGIVSVQDFDERVELLLDIKDCIKDKSAIAYIRDMLMAHNLCPECGKDMCVEQHEECRGEYFGFEANEPMYFGVCDCGWSELNE